MSAKLAFVLSLTLILACRPNLSLCEPLAIGGPPLPEELNLLSADHPLAAVTRESVLAFLTSRAKGEYGLTYRLELSDALKSHNQGKLWAFRVRRGAYFSNGAAIRAVDLLWSLSRCREQGRLPMAADIAIPAPAMYPNDEIWIEITLKDSALDNSNQFPAHLADCPILEKQSSAVFIDALGFGSNLVSAGAFKINDLRPGRSISLIRAQLQSGSTRSLNQLELRGFADPEIGLSALRSGKIALLFTADGRIREKAAHDSTLKTGVCKGFGYAARRSFEMDCSEGLSADKVSYE